VVRTMLSVASADRSRAIADTLALSSST
jgi:hypothetical protein